MENNEENLTGKERADLKNTEREKARDRAENMRKLKKYSAWIGTIVVIGVLVYWGVTAADKAEDSRPGEQQASEGREHIKVGDQHAGYKTNPPTSGPHAEPIAFNSYDTEIADENAIHNMEHGGIWITYKDISEEEIAQLKDIQRKHPKSVILSPRSANDSRISVTSWQRLMHLEVVDVEMIESYIEKNINRSPEPLAS